ncbi:MAG: TetR/AcrR family transcriptional regulator [Candidatus Thiodiazotropha sp. (ex Myrtea spinifera)]|nr:TetR/AcrR family transcriptional regulator [Candidatus Thiodiazotropha sp. (ex Myrtea spinifera)]
MNQPTGRRERKLQQTAEKLVKTAWSLFEERGFEHVTMEAIAEKADVAKGTLYKHFPVKEALLQQAFHTELQQEKPQLMQQLEQIPAGMPRMRAFFKISADWSEQRRHYLPYYLRFRMNARDVTNPGRSGTDQIFSMLIEAGIENGDFRDNLPLESSVHYLSFLYLGALLRWLNDSESPLMEELDRMLGLFLNGVQN